jgi:putative tricarboxylic transport membrane protein
MKRKHADILSGLGFLLVAALFWSLGRDLEGVSAVFPAMLEVFMAGGGLALIINGLRMSAADQVCEDMPLWGRVVGIVIGGIIYVLCIPLIGFYTASALFIFILALAYGQELSLRRAGLYAAFSLLICVLIWGVFQKLLLVPTPEGLFF